MTDWKAAKESLLRRAKDSFNRDSQGNLYPPQRRPPSPFRFSSPPPCPPSPPFVPGPGGIFGTGPLIVDSDDEERPSTMKPKPLLRSAKAATSSTAEGTIPRISAPLARRPASHDSGPSPSTPLRASMTSHETSQRPTAVAAPVSKRTPSFSASSSPSSPSSSDSFRTASEGPSDWSERAGHQQASRPAHMTAQSGEGRSAAKSERVVLADMEDNSKRKRTDDDRKHTKRSRA